jgi:hypothetical protein
MFFEPENQPSTHQLSPAIHHNFTIKKPRPNHPFFPKPPAKTGSHHGQKKIQQERPLFAGSSLLRGRVQAATIWPLDRVENLDAAQSAQTLRQRRMVQQGFRCVCTTRGIPSVRVRQRPEYPTRRSSRWPDGCPGRCSKPTLTRACKRSVALSPASILGMKFPGWAQMWAHSSEGAHQYLAKLLKGMVDAVGIERLRTIDTA